MLAFDHPRHGTAKAIDDGLASLIAREIATRNMPLAGRDDSIEAMASRLGVRRDYVALVRLSYLSPEVVLAILVGQQPIELTPTRLVASGKRKSEEPPLLLPIFLESAAPIPPKMLDIWRVEKGPERHLARWRALGRGFASLEPDHRDGGSVTGGNFGRIPTQPKTNKMQ